MIDILRNYPTAHLLLTPANTPEFSPVENLFGFVKRKLCDFEFTGERGNKKHPRLTFEVMKVMFGIK